jgi:hypothetical protein
VGNENACGVVPTAGPTPALSRSSSRNPMAEIDENTLRNNSSSNNGEPQKVTITSNLNLYATSCKSYCPIKLIDPTVIDCYRNSVTAPSPLRT